ncbi:DUF2953 domain-containing protein [Candidatus Bipolaricaulota bacterium]|nr:DUF2953 domain-containing protein [Candidatus Bipolaricaulota bacterium]
MILWITLTSVLALLFFLLTRWIGLQLQGDEDGLVLSASFSKWEFTLYPGGSDEEIKEDEEVKEKEETKNEEGEKVERKTKDRIKNTIGWLQLVSDFSNLLKNGLNFLRTHGRIAKLDLKGRIGSGDPCLTGTIFGFIEELKGILVRDLPSARIDVRPEFEEEKLDLSGTFGVEIRLIHVVLLIIITLWNLPKRKVWRLARNS